MRRRSLPIVGLTIASLIAACDGQLASTPPSSVSGDLDAGAASPQDASSAIGPYAVACRFLDNPATTSIEENVSFTSDVDGEKTVTLPSATIKTSLTAASDDPNDFVLRVELPSKKLTHDYRLQRQKAPGVDFIGGHGFSGLIYLGSEIQYICSTPNVPASRSPDPQQSSVPITVRCLFEHRQAPDVDAGVGVDKPEQTLVVTSAKPSDDARDDKSLAIAGYSFRVVLVDSPYESRSLNISVETGVAAIQNQLLQMPRARPLVNHFRDNHGVTGRTTLRTSTGDEISFACLSE